MIELDLESPVGNSDSDLVVQGMQAPHAQQVGASSARNAYARRTEQTALNQATFGIDEAATM